MDDTTTSAVYAKLFPEQVADKCSAYALEANNGPFAYLHALYQQALSLEALGDQKAQIPLATRRPDIGERVLDEASLETQIPSLTLVIEAMTHQAQLHAGATKNLAEEIAKAQYPAQLPFHQPLEQIKAVLHKKGTSLFHVLQQADYGFPNFVYGNLRTSELRNVMRKATGFSPTLQALLLNEGPTTDADFLLKRFGVSGNAADALTKLSSVETLGIQTGLKPEDILDLLATSGVPDDGTEGFTTVKRSSAYAPDKDAKAAPIDGHVYGAAFINNATTPALSLEDTLVGAGINMRVKGATADHFGRIHKIIHLQHVLQLPYAEVDLLVMSALRSEGQTKDFHFTENTLRALGVFLHLKNEYRVTAEQFAALINEVSTHAADDLSPLLDQVLDGQGAERLADIDARLVLDGRAFELPPTESLEKIPTNPVVAELCRAFALEGGQAIAYLSQVLQALKLKTPKLTLAFFSSFYRLARLPRLLRLSMSEGWSLIALLNSVNPQTLVQLAGTPTISADDANPDILDVLMGLVNLDGWLKEQRISATALRSWLSQMSPAAAKEANGAYTVDAKIVRTTLDAMPRIKSSLLDEAQIAQAAGLGTTPKSGKWLDALSAFVDSQGLIKPFSFQAPETLGGKLAEALKDKLQSGNALLRPVVDAVEVANILVPLIENAVIAQDDAAKHIIGTAFGKSSDGHALTPDHALPLLRWIGTSRLDLLNDILQADLNSGADANMPLTGLSGSLWFNLTRHAQVVKSLKLSAAGLTALLGKPEWFALENMKKTAKKSEPTLPVLNLDLCYQVSHYRDWITQCEKNGFEEKDALDYLVNNPRSDDPKAVLAAAGRLGQLLGWPQSEAALVLPFTRTAKKTEKKEPGKTVNDFEASLTDSERTQYHRADYRKFTPFGEVLARHLWKRTTRDSLKGDDRAIFDKFETFLVDNPGPLRVTREQNLPVSIPEIWATEIERYIDKKTSPVTFQEHIPGDDTEKTKTEYDVILYMISTISDIDYALRLQNLCGLTGLSCQAMLDLYNLDENSIFDEFRTAGQLILGATDAEQLQTVESHLQEHWRDALAGYLLGYWAISDDLRKKYVTSLDDLSSYFLTDILVSSAVKTSAAIHYTASLQHYLHKLFARLEPGYLNSMFPEQDSEAWRQYMSEFGLWKIWRTQLNHPENLIYYTNRPNKTGAFQSLEVELNQGKLDPELLQTAITGYLTKFEQTSNLQIVSGYLDGIDPKNDTYHFIGKTNASPAEYYWRSVDMGLRDDKERLSPLAWTEWEKIAVAPTGQITQSSYTETKADKTTATYTCDTIRPVMIEGRPYVFWVERGTVGLPSSDEKNQTPTKFKKLSVQYIYKQSDGFWSPPNELMSLDGTQAGKRLTDKNNAFLKDDTYEPGLIALVNVEGERARDPWLTVVLYNCANMIELNKQSNSTTELKLGGINTDYFIQFRDLLLIDKKEIPPKLTTNSSDSEDPNIVIHNSYKDIRKIQHPYNGDTVSIEKKGSTPNVLKHALSTHKTGEYSTPYFVSLGERSYFEKTLFQGHGTSRLTDLSRLTLYKQSPFIYLNINDIKKYKIDKDEVSQNEARRKPLDMHALALLELNSYLLEFNKQHQWNVSMRYYDDTSLYVPASLDSQRYVSNLSSHGSIALNVKAPPKTVQIQATYPKVIVDSDNLKLIKLAGFTAHVKSGNLTYTLKCSGNLLSPKITLAIEISSTGEDIPGIGYTVNASGKNFTKAPVTALPIKDKARHWTYALEIDNAAYLLEDSFRINISSKGNIIASLPVDAGVPSKHCEKICLRLYAKGPKQTSFVELAEESVVADGKAVVTHEYDWTDPGRYTFALCEAGNPLQNVFFDFDIREMGADEKWDISIKRNTKQAQYLDLSSVADQSPTFPTNAIRLNTLFGKQLVSRAARSVERVLEWDAQRIEEPTIDPDIPNPSVDFHGANGIYFRELFLHLPTLVATRLSEQQQFDEAERWFTEYLFDPFRTLTDDKKNTPFWNTRPLAEVGTGTSELHKTVSPTSRAFIQSRYYRQAVFLLLVENWQRQGDHFYRQLTPSTLNHAWLSYQKALKIIEPLPERTAVSRWVPDALKNILAGKFRAPINERVIKARETIQHRLYNLRHGLTLDGKLLPLMDWRTEGADPFGFAQRGIGHQISTYNSSRTQIPAYRFRQLIPMARAAVQQLQDLGRLYMKLMEDEFNATLSVLLKQQEIRICDFTLQIKQEAVNDEITQRRLLELGKKAAVYRKDYYANLISVGRSPTEQTATGLVLAGTDLKSASILLQTAAGITEGTVPTIFGMAFGGNDPGAMVGKAALAAEIAGEVSLFIADQLSRESEYERRAQEWEFELKQAELDIESLDFEISEADIERNAATISLEEARAHRKNLEEAHLAMTTGFTIIPVYNWLVARQELLYAPAYDAVLSLCLGAEAAWRYEIGDYKRPAFVKTSAWTDSYKGMLAGESLLVDLQEMENAYLQSNERRLTIKKTINVWEAKGAAKADVDADVKALKELKKTPLTFSIKSADLDKSYPGHYLRQLKHVSVSFVMAADAGDTMKEVSAILTQTDSTTLVEPTEEGLEYLYYAGTKLPLSLKRNLRAQQQIALSSSAADDGLGFGPGDWVYELMFHDGRYLPFEGTGAISGWQLSFPDEGFVDSLVKDGKSQVKSIQLHLVYTAVDGGKDFTDKVKLLRDKQQPK